MVVETSSGNKKPKKKLAFDSEEHEPLVSMYICMQHMCKNDCIRWSRCIFELNININIINMKL